jgi:hypothetical protein
MLQSLLLTALGGLLGISGSYMAFRWQAGDAKRIRSEQYSREDRYRLQAERIQAYSAFHVAAGHARGMIASGGSETEMRAARNSLWEAYTLVALIGDHATERCAAALLDLVTAVAYKEAQFDRERFAELIRAFMAVSLHELIPARHIDRAELAAHRERIDQTEQ